MKTMRSWKIIALLLVVFGIVARLDQMFNAFEYDEVWTLEHFATRSIKTIFTELVLPNNHPLNSLFVKIMFGFSQMNFVIRMPSLIAGVLSVPALGLVAFYLFGKRSIALWAMFLLAFSAPLIAYSQIARGYSLQVFFCIIFGLALLMLGRFRPKKFRYLPEILLLFTVVASILTLPTSILYLAPAAVLLIIYGYKIWCSNKKKYLPLLLVGIVGTVFVLYWYLGNFDQFREAQKWGQKISAPELYYDWLLSLFHGITTPTVFLFALIGVLFVKRSRKLLLILLFPVLGAILTNAGPPRTYFVLIPVVSLIAAAGLECVMRFMAKHWHMRKLIIPLSFLLCGIFVFECYNQIPLYRQPDWYRLFRELHSLPDEIVVIHRANNSYPFAWNNKPDSYNDYLTRFAYPGPEQRLILFLDENSVNGSNGDGREDRIPLPENSGVYVEEGLIKGYLHKLKPLDSKPKPGDIVFVYVGPLDEKARSLGYSNIFKNNDKDKILLLNCWLTFSQIMALIAVEINEHTEFDPVKANEKIPGIFRFYTIDFD